jgi:hypothetical protein|tara:strand:- start:1426 stop:1596 length:171 start_codon:yes stop_codon:yes gene_type:complete
MKTVKERALEIQEAIYGTVVESSDEYLTEIQGTYTGSELTEVVDKMYLEIKNSIHL